MEHEQVWHTCKRLNAVCGIPSVGVSWLTLGEILITTADFLEGSNASFASLAFTFFMVFTLYIRISAVVQTAGEAKRTPMVLSMTSLISDDYDLADFIMEFQLSRQHNKYKFTACGFLKLNMTLFTSMLGAAMAYGLMIYNELAKASSS